MKRWHSAFSILGIVALVFGMTSGVAFAETGMGSFVVEPYPCDRSDATSDDVTLSLLKGDLYFGSVPPLSRDTVTASETLQVQVVAGCAAGDWAVTMSAQPFSSGRTTVPWSRVTLNGVGMSYAADANALAETEMRWGSVCTERAPNFLDLFRPTASWNVYFDDQGAATTALLSAARSFVECRTIASVHYTQGTGTTVADWNASLELVGLDLTPSSTYTSILTVELNPGI